MSDDLVKRLRKWDYGESTWALLEDAADRIEKLEAALREIREEYGYGFPLETKRMIDAALEEKDD